MWCKMVRTCDKKGTWLEQSLQTSQLTARDRTEIIRMGTRMKIMGIIMKIMGIVFNLARSAYLAQLITYSSLVGRFQVRVMAMSTSFWSFPFLFPFSFQFTILFRGYVRYVQSKTHKEKTFNDLPFILKLITMSKCKRQGPDKTKNSLFD